MVFAISWSYDFEHKLNNIKNRIEYKLKHNLLNK